MKKITSTLVLILLSLIINAQNDSIISKNGTVLFGEIKTMERGVITIETEFSDDDFKITWNNIASIKSARDYRMILSSGVRYYGKINGSNNLLTIIDLEKGTVTCQFDELVYLEHVDKGNFLDVVNLSLDFGWSLTKANNLEQFNGDFTADYYTNNWGVFTYYNTVRSTQDDAEKIKRDNGGLGVKAFVTHGYFAQLQADYYSNNSQSMDLRSNYSVSIGKYLVRTNRIYFNTSIGAAFLNENYSDTITDRNSYEGKVALEYNMFDVGDLNLFTNLEVFPSITEKGRVRTVFKFNLKYDLPRDFFIRGGINYSYDNQPIEGVTKDDYVYTFGFGWEL